jgi:hypothetical protein
MSHKVSIYSLKEELNQKNKTWKYKDARITI